MNAQLGNQNITLPDDAIVALPPQPPKPKVFNDVVADAMDAPIDVTPLSQWDLKGKRVCIMVDDWGRPTPAGEFLPGVLSRLNDAGARDEDITIVTASGMHNPMEESDLARKVGEVAYKRVRCVSHDAGNHEMLSFVGITDLGTPIWVNKDVAEADFKIALGRIYPHVCYGYEGGYKMIVPGVASFETIIRDHSLNFSRFSTYGINLGNPSRAEADAVGRIVGIDFLVNFVMNHTKEPVAAFAGTPEKVYPTGVDFGQRNVWCARTGTKADITVLASDDLENHSLANNPTYYLGLAQAITKDDGVIIMKADYKPRKRTVVDGITLSDLSLSGLLQMHERRNWNLPRREIQHVIKSIRGEFYRRRTYEMGTQKLILVSDTFPKNLLESWNAEQAPTIQAALDAALAEKPNPTVVALPRAQQTLPVVEYDYHSGKTS